MPYWQATCLKGGFAQRIDTADVGYGVHYFRTFALCFGAFRNAKRLALQKFIIPYLRWRYMLIKG